MREALYAYGLFASTGIFAVAAWMAISAFSDGAVPGAHGASASVTAPLAIACFFMAVHCLVRLVKEAR